MDDDDAGRYALTRILRKEGFNVIEAGSGTETLELVKQGPDLILLDVNLPDMSGFEVCRLIKAEKRRICLMPWSGWQPCALMSRTRGSRWFVTIDITAMSAGENEKNKTRMN